LTKHLFKILGISTFIALALGCATPEEIRQQMVNQCYSYGFKPNTDPFAQCMMQLDQQNAAVQERQQACLAYAGYKFGTPEYNVCMAVAR